TANVSQIFPAFNGGGITFVFDADGSIFSNYLGFAGVLGVTFIEATAGTEIVEAVVFLNGSKVVSNDTTGAGFSGTFTHQFGHALNLAHSQANGQANHDQESGFPFGCTNQPFTSNPPSVKQNETMYPFSGIGPGGTNQYMFTVDRLDDIAAISDLYPAPGWPQNYGTIQGTISYLTKILGNGTGPSQQITGVNVIARNLANPYNDF